MIGNQHNSEEPCQHYEVRVRLTIQKGRARNLIRDINGPVFTLGTDQTCDMVLGDLQFPDVHSYVCIRDKIVSLRHLGQGPNVTVNGREVRWGELRDGDRIRTGSYEFRINIERRAVSATNQHNDPHQDIAFAGTLEQLPIWWSSVTGMPVNWKSLAANKSSRRKGLGP